MHDVLEIEKALEIYGQAHAFDCANGWNFWYQSFERDMDHVFAVPLLGDVRVVQRVMGDEDDSRCWIVFEVSESVPGCAAVKRYFKKEGSSDSYDSADWFGAFAPVTPREKTVVIYEYV